MEKSPNRLRVLFYVATMDVGGAERQMLELLRRIDRTQFEPVLGLAVRQGPLLGEIPDDVPLHACQEATGGGRFGTGRLQRWQFLARLLKRERIDVVFDQTFQATLDIGPASWWRKTPRVSMIVADPQIQLDLYFSRRQWLWKRFSDWVYRMATTVLANSEGLRRQVIEQFGRHYERTQVLPNVLNLERIDQLAAEAIPPRAGRFRLLTVARVDRHKGHRDLLEALRRLVLEQGRRELLWQIVGDGAEREALEADVQRLGLTEQIEFLGAVSNPYPYYRAADLFCLPSLTEGLPNVLLEALALGAPVLSTDCKSGPREILEDGKWGTLVPVQDPPALAAAIAERMAHPETWLVRARSAQPVIRERYDAARGVKLLERYLLAACGHVE